jgi:hypothetical protein
MNYYHLCRRYPPVLVRLLARRNGRAMTTAQIAEAAGQRLHLTEAAFVEPAWDNLPLATVMKLTRACGMDFTSRRDVNRAECYLRKNGSRPAFKYLVKSSEWQTYYLPLLVNWRKSMSVIPQELPKPICKLLTQLPT